jgi:hypothetical protein
MCCTKTHRSGNKETVSDVTTALDRAKVEVLVRSHNVFSDHFDSRRTKWQFLFELFGLTNRRSTLNCHRPTRCAISLTKQRAHPRSYVGGFTYDWTGVNPSSVHSQHTSNWTETEHTAGAWNLRLTADYFITKINDNKLYCTATRSGVGYCKECVTQ